MSKVIGAVAVTLVVAAILVWWFALRGESVETVPVTRGSIDVTIQTIGRVQSTGSTTVRTQTAGQVSVVAVGPGDFVREDDILLQLDSEPLERAVDDAERALEDTEFALQRSQRDAEQNLDDEDLALAVILAGQRVERAERDLADAEEALRHAVILAPRDAIVLDEVVSIGDILSRSQPVATLYTRADLEVIADVDELDLVNVEPAAAASVRLDAYPAEEIVGEIVSTSPAAREQGGATVFATTIAITIPDGLDIRPGMNADVTIVTDERDDVLLIPQQAIRTVGERAFVSTLVDGELIEHEIQIGYRSGGQVEVVSGLSEGDRVAIQ